MDIFIFKIIFSNKLTYSVSVLLNFFLWSHCLTLKMVLSQAEKYENRLKKQIEEYEIKDKAQRK